MVIESSTDSIKAACHRSCGINRKSKYLCKAVLQPWCGRQSRTRAVYSLYNKFTCRIVQRRGTWREKGHKANAYKAFGAHPKTHTSTSFQKEWQKTAASRASVWAARGSTHSRENIERVTGFLLPYLCRIESEEHVPKNSSAQCTTSENLRRRNKERCQPTKRRDAITLQWRT